MFVNNNKQEELRHERKFLMLDYSPRDIEQLIKLNPACFSEIYNERKVNNIYIDTFGFNNYYDNIDGNTDRLKVRVRWYGELFGKIEKPVLELKIKKGLLGKKESYPILPFVLDTNFSEQQIQNAVSSEKIPVYIRDLVKSLKPTLLNCYKRKYFISADKRFRITIDSQLTYYRINYIANTFLNRSVDYNITIVELKYDSTFETDAKHISNMFPFALTKSSKYLQGLERTIF